MSKELRECPFCWGEATIRRVYPIDNHYPLFEEDVRSPIVFVGCKNCGIDIQYTPDFWNTRPAEDALKVEIIRYRRALYSLKDDCTKRMHFVVSNEEKLFLTETILHIEAELDFNPDTKKGGENE